MTGYPKGFYTLLLATLFVLPLTGVLLTPTLLALTLGWDVPWRLAYDGRVLVAVAHVVASFITFSLIGAMWAIHMRRGWTLRRNRISGATLLGLFALLGLSGTGIYYFGGELSSAIASLSHTALGYIAVIGFTVHFLRGRKSKAAGFAAPLVPSQIQN
nr:MAG: hypothetical protein E4H34_03035 [Hyphomicrobiales bacterium]